jgi:lipopolysaccharide export system protein LptA
VKFRRIRNLSCGVFLGGLVAAGPVCGQEQPSIDKPQRKLSVKSVKSGEERRKAFEEAMQKIAEAERKQAEEKSLKEWRKTAAKKAQKKLREFVDREAEDIVNGAVSRTDSKRLAARNFAIAATGKVPEDVAQNFKPLISGGKDPPPLLDPAPDIEASRRNITKAVEVAPPPASGPALPPPPPLPATEPPIILPPPPPAVESLPVAPLPVAPLPVAPLPDVTQGDVFHAEDPMPRNVPLKAIESGHGQADTRTVIDADGSLIFDGSGRFGEEYQAVIFEDNVVVTNPEFTMTSDHLTAYFRKSKKPESTIGSIPPEPEGQASRLERAVATGDEVTVRKTLAGGEVQVAKSRKATFIARDPMVKGTFDEVMLEIWPRVQRGNNLIIARSQDTVIILRRDEMIVNGPVRTEIVGGSGLTPGSVEKDAKEGTPDLPGKDPKTTVIDAARGAIFNRLDPATGNREMFFEGDVRIADSDFDISCETLTAYMRSASETKGLQKAVANGIPGKRVRVERRVDSGEMQLGLAEEVTYVIATGDVILDVWPEIRRGGHSSVAKRRDARIVMRKNGSVESRGVDMQIVPDSNGSVTEVNEGS